MYNHKYIFYISVLFGVDFYLVNSDGERTDDGDGLLIYKGGTVCDDYFSDNSANSICKAMGYDDSVSWESGNLFSIQGYHDITLDNVRCSSSTLSSCS